MARVLIPLPRRDFDPTEVAVSWQILSAHGHAVVFATPDGQPAAADPIMLSGRGLDPWSPLPLIGHIKIIGLLLRADARARRAFAEMLQAPAFQRPLRWDALQPEHYDALLLGGGHWARGMREYLESPLLQAQVRAAFAADKPVAAVCHGVVLAARSLRADGRSVLHGRKTTALTWRQERTASLIAHIGRFWDRHYYRTYLEAPGEAPGYRSVQQEVTRALADPADFRDVPADDPLHLRKTLGLARDCPDDASPAFVVRDGRYVSARWPGDVHTFAQVFAGVLHEVEGQPGASPGRMR